MFSLTAVSEARVTTYNLVCDSVINIGVRAEEVIPLRSTSYFSNLVILRRIWALLAKCSLSLLVSHLNLRLLRLLEPFRGPLCQYREGGDLAKKWPVPKEKHWLNFKSSTLNKSHTVSLFFPEFCKYSICLRFSDTAMALYQIPIS